MPRNPFEIKVGEALRRVPGLWVFHPPDVAAAKAWNPGDYIFGCAKTWGVVEVKRIDGHRFPLSRWTQQQRNTCAQVVLAGGYYWLLVGFFDRLSHRAESVRAYLPRSGSFGPSSLGLETGLVVDLKDLTFLVNPLPPPSVII